MSRCCPRTPQKIIIQCGADAPPAETYTFSNANVTGVGVFISEVDNAVTFKGIASSDGTITVSNDAPNNTVNLVINAAAIPALVPDASPTVKGKIEIADTAEVLAGSDILRAVVPATLAALTSTTLRRGLVELATDAETQTGTDTVRAVTPAGLKSATDLMGVTQFFANAGARGTAVPALVGQLGVQQDTGLPYVGTNTVAGAWSPGFFFIGSTMTLTGDTTVDAFGGNLVVTDTNAGQGGIMVNGNGYVHIETGGVLNFASGGRVHIAGVVAPASRLLGLSATAGQVTTVQKTEFLGSSSATAEYTVTNGIVSRTFDADTVTTPELADIVHTLLVDLNALTRPVFPA